MSWPFLALTFDPRDRQPVNCDLKNVMPPICLLDLPSDRDPCSSSRAGSFDCVDAVLPWRYEDPLSLPPPVPPKNDMRRHAQSATTTVTPTTEPERVTRRTPWLHRPVKTPVTRTANPALVVPSPQKASSTTDSADISGGSPTNPKPQPPAYHAVSLQQQILPTQERPAITTTMTTKRGPLPVVRALQPVPVQVRPRTPPKPAPVAAAHHRSARGETPRRGGPTSHPHPSGSPQLRSVRSAHEERTRSRRGRTRPPTPVPVQSQSEHAHLPSYHSALPFPSPPPPPPYRVSPQDSYPTSLRSRSLPRSSHKHEKTTPLPPLPPLPLPSHPQLSRSAISRITAGLKVSKEFGDAILQQELRMATPTPDHSRLDPVSNPRQGQRYLSVSELRSHRNAMLFANKITLEHEACQRPSNKSSPNLGRCSGDSRQRAASTHSGRGQEKGSQRGRR